MALVTSYTLATPVSPPDFANLPDALALFGIATGTWTQPAPGTISIDTGGSVIRLIGPGFVPGPGGLAGTVTKIELDEGFPPVAAGDIEELAVDLGALVATILDNDVKGFKALLYGGADTMLGGAGQDHFEGGGGGDRLFGNAGDDVLLGDEGGDRLSGAAGNDLLSGGTGNDRLAGGGGFDWLAGGAGNDLIEGNAQADTLAGGGGADRFLYRALSDSGAAPLARDAILDFAAAQGDVIDLSLIDADPFTGADDAFVFIGTAAFAANDPGTLRYQAVAGGFVVYANTDDDIQAEFSILISGALAPVATDFAL